jgi:hypothetical protein
LIEEKIDPRLALTSACLLLTAPNSTKWLLAYSSGPDAMHVFLLALAYRLIQKRWWWAFSAVLLVGVFNKETILILWLAALVSCPGGRPLVRPKLAVAATILPAAIAFVAVRWIWRARVTGYTYGGDIASNLNLKFFAGTTMSPSFLPQLVEFPASLFIVYGMAAIIIAVQPRRSARILAANPAMSVFLAGSLSASFVGSHDSARCMPYVAVPIFFVCATLVQQQWDFFRRPWVWIPLAAAQVYLSDLVRFDLRDYPNYMPHYMQPSIALGYLTAWAIGAAMLMGLRIAYARTVSSPAPSAKVEENR